MRTVCVFEQLLQKYRPPAVASWRLVSLLGLRWRLMPLGAVWGCLPAVASWRLVSLLGLRWRLMPLGAVFGGTGSAKIEAFLK